jgi:hypothetical protein
MKELPGSANTGASGARSTRLLIGLQVGGFLLLACYSVLLMLTEFRNSQDYVRPFFTDVRGPVFLYAINTTLTTTLMWCTAMLFVVCCLIVADQNGKQRARWFFASQVIIFLYLGFDDRFLLHETLGPVFHVNDAYILVAIGAMEVLLIAFLGEFRRAPWIARVHLLLGAAFFGLMAAIDGLAPARAVLRLSIEDLSKTWSCVFLFLFAMWTCNHHIAELKTAARRSRTFEERGVRPGRQEGLSRSRRIAVVG